MIFYGDYFQGEGKHVDIKGEVKIFRKNKMTRYLLNTTRIKNIVAFCSINEKQMKISSIKENLLRYFNRLIRTYNSLISNIELLY